MALTRRQREVYDYVADHIRSRGYAPSFVEIASSLGRWGPAMKR